MASLAIWDYDTSKLDLTDPVVKRWYLNRRLSFGDLRGLSKTDLKENFDQLKIDASLKELLKNFLHKYA